ncbi:hypothetical protein WOLCODRAFT_167571 [Wolfiporia cocos MD-104 SS10]|uniref:Uncharacterized protein n=1 Tax=Wolfiporia cocos (strain MD-104) TaxID=742152 RepID=A0A2H3JFL7_WOLCO|nr:hypothetical protein WOLCODRAFT_167571 [Wolfiporia cocos MD-104 SS10]
MERTISLDYSKPGRWSDPDPSNGSPASDDTSIFHECAFEDRDALSDVPIPESSSPIYSSPGAPTPPDNDLVDDVSVLSPPAWSSARIDTHINSSSVTKAHISSSEHDPPDDHQGKDTSDPVVNYDAGILTYACSSPTCDSTTDSSSSPHQLQDQLLFVNQLHDLLLAVRDEEEKFLRFLKRRRDLLSNSSPHSLTLATGSGRTTGSMSDKASLDWPSLTSVIATEAEAGSNIEALANDSSLSCPVSNAYSPVCSMMVDPPRAATHSQLSGSQSGDNASPDYWVYFGSPDLSVSSASFSQETLSNAHIKDHHSGSQATTRVRATGSMPMKRRRSLDSTTNAASDAYTQLSERVERWSESASKRRKVHTVESRFFASQQSSKNTSKRSSSVGRSTLANRPASLRRAESLRSEASAVTGAEENQHESVVLSTSSSHSLSRSRTFTSLDRDSRSATPAPCYSGYVPSEPATPISHRRRRRAMTPPRSPLPMPLPIIAPPPPDEIPRAPLSTEDAAEARIKIMLEKERVERDADGLAAIAVNNLVLGELICTSKKSDDKRSERNDEDTAADVDTPETIAQDSSPWSARPFSMHDSQPSYDKDSKFEDDLRMTVIDWILDVLPRDGPSSTKCAWDLRDQLATSDVTRFHAAYLLIRYFFRIGPTDSAVSSPESPTRKEQQLQLDGQQALTWDIALACVTLSVKFHRDVFLPLYSIPANNFMLLAPHSLSYEDLEAAQRDILYTFSFSIGSVTPESYISELWLALPSLRSLLSFDGGWNTAQKETWAVLLEALMQPDVLRFPISLLTASALLDGVIDTLVERYKFESLVKGGHKLPDSCDAYRKRAVKASAIVALDVEELLGLSKDDVYNCRRWLRSPA